MVYLKAVRDWGFFMSTSEEIQAVYEYEIAQKSYLVEMKRGKQPFYDNFKGMSIRRNFDYDPTEVKTVREE